MDPDELAQAAADENRVDWRKTVPAGTKLAAFVGQLIPEKGALPLAQAVLSLPDWSLVVAGTGPQLDALQQLAQQSGGRVVAPGTLPHTQIVQLLSQADCCCLPTLYAEGFPTTLLEAAACGCPIVCTHTAGTGELLPGGDDALFLPSADTAEIAAALQKTAADPAAAKARSQRAKQTLLGRFTWQAVYEKLRNIVN